MFCKWVLSAEMGYMLLWTYAPHRVGGSRFVVYELSEVSVKRSLTVLLSLNRLRTQHNFFILREHPKNLVVV